MDFQQGIQSLVGLGYLIFNIALGTAKGLAYLREDCEVKIPQCDIKPENVLLDDKFVAKVSDFGMAKLIDREESMVYTMLRGKIRKQT